MNGNTDIIRYKDIVAETVDIPDNENVRQIKLGKSRV